MRDGKKISLTYDYIIANIKVNIVHIEIRTYVKQTISHYILGGYYHDSVSQECF